MPVRKIVILGGGYAGLTAALKLDLPDRQITLVNAHRYHHLTTMLHQPAVGSRHYKDLSVDLPQVLPRSIRMLRGTVTGIDPAKRCAQVRVRGGEKRLDYDILVLALGWQPEFFGIPGLRENALTLEDLNTSRSARDRIEQSLLAFDRNDSETWRTSFVVGGGGLTGVELTGELLDSLPHLARAFDLSPRELSIHLVEGASTLLPGLDPWMAEETRAYLGSRGVRIITGRRITNVAGQAVHLSDGATIPAGVVFWTGGVKANAVPKEAGLPTGKSDRVIVNRYLQAQGHPEIFVGGDCALAIGPEGRPLPPTAWLAVQHGRSIASNIRRYCSGESMQPFRPSTPALILSLGRRQALGVVYGRRVSGAMAAMLKDMLAFRHIFSIGGIPLAVRKLWEWAPYLVHLHRV